VEDRALSAIRYASPLGEHVVANRLARVPWMTNILAGVIDDQNCSIVKTPKRIEALGEDKEAAWS
jgi:hypothetical protein